MLVKSNHYDYEQKSINIMASYRSGRIDKQTARDCLYEIKECAVALHPEKQEKITAYMTAKQGELNS